MFVVVGSWRGIGATTTGLLLADWWSSTQDAWFVEADPAGGVLSARMLMAAASVGGLERVAFPSAGRTMAESFDAVSFTVGQLHLVSCPADPFRSSACHESRAPWIADLAHLGEHVVVDVGRIRAGTPAWPLLELADLVILVSSPEVAAAVSTAEWIHSAGRISRRDASLTGDRLRVVIVDSPGGVGFSRAVLDRELDELSLGWIPWDPHAVQRVLDGGSLGDRASRRSPLRAAVAAVAQAVDQFALREEVRV